MKETASKEAVEGQFLSELSPTQPELDIGGVEMHAGSYQNPSKMTPPGLLTGRKQYSQAFVDNILARNNVDRSTRQIQFANAIADGRINAEQA